MRIPIHGGLHDRLDDLVNALKAPPLQGQAAQLLPPRLDQVQPAGILGMNSIATSGQAINAVCVSREICVLRLSAISTHSRAG